MNLISKKQLEKLTQALDNPVDRFIIAGFFYGLNGELSHKENMLNLTVDSVDLENNTISTPEGKIIVMDSFLKNLVVDAINQSVYIKMGTQGRSNEDYSMNENSKYIIKSRPTKSNDFGLQPLTASGLKNRVRMISDFLFGDMRLTPSVLKQSGAFHRLLQENKKLTIHQSEAILKEAGLSIRRNNIVLMLKYINQIH